MASAAFSMIPKLEPPAFVFFAVEHAAAGVFSSAFRVGSSQVEVSEVSSRSDRAESQSVMDLEMDAAPPASAPLPSCAASPSSTRLPRVSAEAPSVKARAERSLSLQGSHHAALTHTGKAA